MQHRETLQLDDRTEILVQTAQLDEMSREDFVELYLAHAPKAEKDKAEKWADKQHTARKHAR